MLDFAKAFDKVPHARLLHKLDFYGVRGNTNKWISSFLGDRKQQVLLENCHSSSAEVLSGVPQGTVPRPLLFLAYINDLPEVTKSSNPRIFTDDTLLFRPITNQHDSDLLQQDLTALEEWEKMWQMDFNASKCSVIHILPSKRKHVIDSSYTLHGQTLETVEESKYLGVTISDNLTWTRHTENVTGKGNKTLGFLRRNFKDCTTQVKAATYTTMVRPTLEYATTVWDPYLQKDIKAVEQVQRRAARYVLNDYSTRTPGCVTGMVSKLHWESLETRRRNDRSLCCIGSSMDWSTYIQTATYNKVTEEQEGNIVSTKKELGVRPTVIPSSQEQSGTGTCYHLGQHQRRHWRDSGQTLLFATQCPATRLPVVDVHSFNRF